MAKLLTGPDKDTLLKLHGLDLSVSNITKLFGWTANKKDGKFTRIPPKYKTTDLVHLEAGEYINIEAVDTTVGSILWNKLFVEGTVEAAIPNHFYNEVITGKQLEKFLALIEKGLINKVIDIEHNLVPFLKNYEFYSMKLVTIFSPSYTQKMFETNPKILKEKERLIKGMKDPDSLSEMVRIEDTLVNMAKDEMKGDPSMALYDSGSRGSFDNDYKNMNLIVGPTKNEATGKYEFITSSYLEGLKKEDLVAMGNMLVNASYPKAVGTAESGYITKQFYAAYQTIMADPELEDCGTPHTLDFILTEDMVNDFTLQYIMDNGKPVLLTDDNVSKYIGKKIKLRSPMFCGGDKLCKHCVGELPSILGIDAVGLTTGRVPNTIMAKKMKLFHNAKVKYDVVDVDKLLKK